ncbi:MAG TPA: TIGR03617 family F420-dependent LLM class oxidoreductase [Rhodoglobus sp.]|nr:TIGR03617 family F420-dependent LLM class oxidoreductase [Rhodoglobus sp.]
MTRPFLVDLGGSTEVDPLQVRDAALTAEAEGYDGVLVPETKHDPFVGATLAGAATQRIHVGTAIAVALARNPMSTAVVANDVQLVAHGRFALGLGSQVKPHIEKRFSMPWSQPAARMEEYVQAVRAIQQAWATGGKLSFTGEFYAHTLMTPFFDPGPNPFGPPPIWLAGVGERMTEVAGRVADGFLCHSFTTRRYLDEVTLPALARGGRAVEVAMPSFVVLGSTQQELDAAAMATRAQIAFYGSTPSYLPVLDLHGWSGLAERLNAASRRGEWREMAAMIDDDVLSAFAVIGSPAEVAAQLRERFGGIATRVSFNAPYPVDPAAFGEVLAALDA